ncbi:MAG: LptF/LptG family permease [Epsilonproteobacteria bacterium]|nr:LptF/LptG family permease [Campylobacterota bacterium]
MLARFFYQRFMSFFLLAASVCFVFFTSCNVFLRLQFIPFLGAIPLVCWYMLPLIGIYAFPFASSFAVAHVLGNIIAYNQDGMIYFLSAARSSLHRAVLLFSLTLAVLYAPLVFEYGPQSYSKGKQFLLIAAKEQLAKLEPGKIHTPFPGFMVSFAQKEFLENGYVELQKIMVALMHKKRGAQFFVAQRGQLRDNIFQLYNGSAWMQQQSGKEHVVHFGHSRLDLKSFFQSDSIQEDSKLGHVKFTSLAKLLQHAKHSREALFELHKRVTTVLWQLFFPLLACLAMMLWGQGYSNILRSIMLSGGLYFIYFANLGIAQMCSKNHLLSFFLLYIPVLLFFSILLVLYRRRFY